MLLLPVLALGLGAPLTQLFLTAIIFVCSSAHALEGTLNRLDCLIALRQQNNIFLVLFHTCLAPSTESLFPPGFRSCDLVPSLHSHGDTARHGVLS